MDILSELEKAGIRIKDTQNGLEAIDSSLQSLEKEVAILTNLESTLTENMFFLTRRKTIAVASEFKKIREDLIKTSNRLAFLRIDREHHVKAKIQLEAILARFQDTFDNLVKISDNNVVRVDFRRKDG